MTKFFYIIFCLSLVLVPSVSFAAGPSISLNNLDLPDYIYGGLFDNQVFDFTLDVDTADTLEYFTIKNRGNVADSVEIDRFVLYADDGNGQFDGYGIDTEISEAKYRSNSAVWAFEEIGQPLSVGENRFFITVETLRKGTTGKTFDLYFPEFDDVNGNGSYDIGDLGIFLGSGSFPLTGSMSYSYGSRYKLLTGDYWAPVLIVSNLEDGETISSGDFTVTGITRDQGGSFPLSVDVCIDSACEPVVDTGTHYDTWEYQWTDIPVGEHLVYAKTTDFNNNQTITDEMTITVEQGEVPVPEFSAENSSYSFDKKLAIGNQVDPISLDVTVRDTNNNPIINKIIRVSEIRDEGAVVVKSKYVDSNGLVNFKLRSAKAGTKSISITTEDGDVIADNLNIDFSEVALDIDYSVGRWVKLADQTAVYLLDNNNVRHAYPTTSVWQSYWGDDFSFVETVSVDELATYSLGRNVPFNSGTLMKIPSVAKVYYVAQNASIHWVTDEVIAASLYGSNWATTVKDLPESFFTDYSVGVNLD